MIPRFPAFLKESRSACALSSRDGPQKAARAVIEALALLRGRKHLSTVRTLLSAPAALRRRSQQICRRCVAARAMPASCVPQGRGVAPQACRLLACGKAGKGTAKPPARTCFFLSIKRGPSRRSVARRDSGGTPPRTCFFLSIKRERQLAAPRRESLSGSTRREETAEALRRESFSGSTR